MQSDKFGLCDKSLGNGNGINHKSSGFKLLKIKGFSGNNYIKKITETLKRIGILLD